LCQFSPNKNGSIAISHTDFELKVFDKYNFLINRKYYPRYDSTGKENKYCPKFGSPLVSYCANCKKNIEDHYSNYCMGCGNELFFDFLYLTRDEGGQNALNKIWNNTKIREDYMAGSGYYFWMYFDNIDEDLVDIINFPNDDTYIEGDDNEHILYTIKYLFGNIAKKRYSENYHKWTVEDFKIGPRSEIKELSMFFTQWLAKLQFIKQYAIEVDKIIENPEESNFQPNEVKPDSNENSMDEE
jgi:hypothetical protein